MGFHLANFFKNQAIGATNVALNFVNDPIIPTNAANEALLPMDFRVRAGLAYGVGITRPRLSAPNLRVLPLPHLRPVQVAVAAASPEPVDIVPEEYALPVLKNSGLTVQTTNTDVGAQDHRCALWLEDRFEPAPVGPCWTVRFTAAVVTAANTYASGVLTPEDQLPAGRYAIVGMDVWGTNVIAARLIFATGGLRPGTIGAQAVNTVLNNFTRYGRMGLWGYFENTTVPQLELLSNGVTVTQEVFLDVVKVG